MTTRNLKLNVTPGGAPVVVRVSQYENDSRTLRFNLVGTEEMLAIPSGTTAKVEGTKPSGKGFSYSCSLSGTEVTVTIKDQMTAESGRVPCEVVLRNGTTRLGAGRFELEVEPAGLKAGTITSSDTFDSIIRDEVRECAEEQLIVLTVDTELSSESSAPVANSTLCNFFAGALKGKAHGEVVRVEDLSPIEHNVEVRVKSKNLYNINAATYEEVNEAYTVSGNRLKYGETYTVISDTPMCWFKVAANHASGYGCVQHSEYTEGFTSFTFILERHPNVTEGTALRICVENLEKNAKGNLEALRAMNIRVVDGGSFAEYTPYTDPSTAKVTDGEGNTYTPKTDGTVEGLTSATLATTLSTDTEGTIIECEYNRDLTAAIKRIEAALFN